MKASYAPEAGTAAAFRPPLISRTRNQPRSKKKTAAGAIAMYVNRLLLVGVKGAEAAVVQGDAELILACLELQLLEVLLGLFLPVHPAGDLLIQVSGFERIIVRLHLADLEVLELLCESLLLPACFRHGNFEFPDLGCRKRAPVCVSQPLAYPRHSLAQSSSYSFDSFFAFSRAASTDGDGAWSLGFPEFLGLRKSDSSERPPWDPS